MRQLACYGYTSVTNADQHAGTHCLRSVSLQSYNEPVRSVSFKIATFIYKAHHDLVPQHITDLIVLSTSVEAKARTLLQSKFAECMFAVAGQFQLSRMAHLGLYATCTEFSERLKFAERTSAVAGPFIWNFPPWDIRDTY